MKKTVIIICMMLMSYSAFSQQIKTENIELDDLLVLLKASGYELFNFDITDMLKERYNIEVVSKEYTQEGEINSRNLISSPNKKLLSDFPESFRQEIIDEGRIIDSETKAISHAEKITFGFFPAESDTIARLQVHISEFMTMKVSLNLRSITMKDFDEKFYKYHTRPFKIRAFEEDIFIPLILYGSMWYDEKFDIFRFCGEKEIDPNLSSEILKNLPHYYVIGLIFKKTQ